MVSSITSKLPSVSIARAPKVKGGKGKKMSLNQDDDDQDEATGFAAVMSKVAGPSSSLTADAQTSDASTPSAADRLAARDLVRRK
jgi:hypothetical protein